MSVALRMLVVGLLVSSCGGGDEAPAGDSAGDSGPSYAPCQARPDPGLVTHVDIQVSSPLPAELSTSCTHGSVSDLVAYISIPAEDNCFLDVSTAGVSGCCAGVSADQSTWIDLNFRSEAENAPIAAQRKFVELPTTSPPVLDLSFAGVAVDDDWDTDSDSTGNLIEWCAGTL